MPQKSAVLGWGGKGGSFSRKLATAMFFLTVDCRLSNFINKLKWEEVGGEGRGCTIMRHAMTTKNDFLIQLVASLYSVAKY